MKAIEERPIHWHSMDMKQSLGQDTIMEVEPLKTEELDSVLLDYPCWWISTSELE